MFGEISAVFVRLTCAEPKVHVPFVFFLSECIGFVPPDLTAITAAPVAIRVEPINIVSGAFFNLLVFFNFGVALVWQELLRSLYPGCPFEREVVGLELVQLVLSELLPVGELDASTQSKATLSKVKMHLFVFGVECFAEDVGPETTEDDTSKQFIFPGICIAAKESRGRLFSLFEGVGSSGFDMCVLRCFFQPFSGTI